MMKHLCVGASVLIVAIVVLRSTPTPVDACAPAPPPNVIVEIASESAVIIWDEKTKTETFIRRATFNTAAKDFGFLVPTPTEPTLDEIGDEVFTALAKITEPKTVEQKRPTNGGGCGIGCGMAMAPKSSEAGSVEVLQEKDVGGYKAAVLKATDADKLAAWLKDNGYDSRPALTRWLEKYVAEKYIITAFKIQKKEDKSESEGVSSSAVRMTFSAPKPFFPYSEPSDMRDAKGKRLLRIFYIGPQKATGTIGEKGEWPGKIAWANELTAAAWHQLPEKLPKIEAAWLTEFEDSSSPRPGTADVFFSANADQKPVERPARIVYVSAASTAAMPTYVGCAALMFAFFLLRWTRGGRSE